MFHELTLRSYFREKEWPAFASNMFSAIRMGKVQDLINKMVKYGFGVDGIHDCGQHGLGIWLTKIIMRKVTFTDGDL